MSGVLANFAFACSEGLARFFGAQIGRIRTHTGRAEPRLIGYCARPLASHGPGPAGAPVIAEMEVAVQHRLRVWDANIVIEVSVLMPYCVPLSLDETNVRRSTSAVRTELDANSFQVTDDPLNGRL